MPGVSALSLAGCGRWGKCVGAFRLQTQSGLLRSRCDVCHDGSGVFLLFHVLVLLSSSVFVFVFVFVCHRYRYVRYSYVLLRACCVSCGQSERS